MSAILRLIIAGATAALISAPAGASERAANLETAQATAQEECRGWGVRCEPEITPEYCIARDKCAIALPGIALVRYDARMDAILGR